MLIVPAKTIGWQQQPVSTKGQVVPGLMIYRFMHNMYYANSQLLNNEITELVRSANPALSWFCIDAAAVNDVDYTAAETLRELHGILAGQGVRLVMCEVVDEVIDEFVRSRLTGLFGKDAFFISPAAVVDAYYNSPPNKEIL